MDRGYSQRGWGTRPTGPRRSQGLGGLLRFGKLQIAGLLLIIVFIWCVVSAVTIAMFEIHLLSLTEYEDDDRSDVYGYVMDENGESILNATVVIHGTAHFARTNSQGYYSIQDVKDGDYEIEASKDTYGSVTKRVTLNSQIPKSYNFVLEEGGFDITVNERYESNLTDLRFLNQVPAIFILIYGSIALIGGIFAYLQRFYWIAMIGGISGIVGGFLSIGIVIGPILSIIALMYIIREKEEFITMEVPFFDRLFGVERAGTRRGAPARAAPQRRRAPATKPKVTKVKTRTFEGDYAPMYKSKPMKEGEPEEMPRQEPPLMCTVCKGAIKNPSHGIECACGAFYHKFCASSTSACKKCGEPL